MPTDIVVADKQQHKYMVKDHPDGTYGLRVVELGKYLETEEAEVEGVRFTSVADLLRYVGTHYPGAHEVWGDEE